MPNMTLRVLRDNVWSALSLHHFPAAAKSNFLVLWWGPASHHSYQLVACPVRKLNENPPQAAGHSLAPPDTTAHNIFLVADS